MSASHKASVTLLALAAVALPGREHGAYAQDGSFCDLFMGRYLVRTVEPSDITLCLAEIDAKRPEAKKKLAQMIRDNDLSMIDVAELIPGATPPTASMDIVREWDLRKALLSDKVLADFDFVYKLGGKPCRDVLDWSYIEEGSPAWKDNIRGCVSEMQRVHPVAWSALKELEPGVDAGSIPARADVFAAFESEAEAATGRRFTLGEHAGVNPPKGPWSYVKFGLIALLGLAALASAFILGRRTTSKTKGISLSKGETPNPGHQADG